MLSTPLIQVDSEIDHVREKSVAQLQQELGFASHLGIPALMLPLRQSNNINLARILYEKMLNGLTYQIWVTLPLVHPSRYSPLSKLEEQEDSWEW